MMTFLIWHNFIRGNEMKVFYSALLGVFLGTETQMLVIGSFIVRIHIIMRKRQISATWQDLRGTQEKTHCEIPIPLSLPGTGTNNRAVM